MSEIVNTEKAAILARVQLESGWKSALADALTSESMGSLRQFLTEQKKKELVVFPPNNLIFNAFNTTPFDQVKVVILGQDPYHGARQANGLAFSVQRSIPIPPSLRNIMHELSTDLGIKPAGHGDLTSWAEQGVLLLNSVMTVVEGQPTSHQGRGWEEFTDHVIDVVNEQTNNTVFILWGAYAQKKGQFIDRNRHLVLTAVHPSPLAANRGGFFGLKPFSKTNQYLVQHGKSPINWQLN
ncbi:uracil-DNA glycosylase [Aquirhabdus sp.]|uniref:uracil-DNA glycosylase n=1 Tax=Aquirhabdus sp. TaxID=2824160 RepID=UPI00396CA088